MDSKTNIYSLWIQYTTQNEESYFWQFISGFVEIWEKQCGVDFNSVPLWSEIQPDSVPILAKLPDELLAAIGKFLYISNEKIAKESNITNAELEEIHLLFRCLFIICRNFDNIPLIASCDFVNLSEPIASRCIKRLFNSSDIPDDDVKVIKSIISSFCHFLEGMYDPYLTWRNHLSNHNADFNKLLFKPSLLHVEVIPFIYDCFQTDAVFSHPFICTELLNVLGATISGAQSMLFETNNTVNISDANFTSEINLGNGHNALRAVCPATVALIIRIISNVKVKKDVRDIALNCFTVMVQVLHKSTPEQRQIELSLILEMYTDSIKKIMSGSLGNRDTSIKLEDNSGSISISDNENLNSISENIDRTDQSSVDEKKYLDEELSYMLCSALNTIRRLLDDFESSRSTICQLMVDLNYINILISIPDCVMKLGLDKQSLGVECVKTLTRLLALSRSLKRKSTIKCDYDTIIIKWINLGTPSKELLQEFVYMAMDGEKNNDIQTPLCNAEVVITLLHQIHLMSKSDQVWLSKQISLLCTKNLRSKWLACQKGTILSICEVLIHHEETLPNQSIVTLINLLDDLACISISSQELKKVFFILRPEKKFSHKIPLLHTLCNITRNGDNICKTYLDIQSETDGINVPNINKWNNNSYGFTFHCWLRLDKFQESHASHGKQRQLLNLLTQSCQGLEIFIDSSGVLFMNILKKNAVQTASVTTANLNDNKWHCLSVCILYARRALNYDQISVFIDGTQRLAVSMKFQGFGDPFVHCYIGAPLAKETKLSNKKQEVEKESFHGTFVKSIFSNQFLPSIVLQAPSYLSSFGSVTSKSGQSNAAGTTQESSNRAPLHGHIAHVSLFNDTLTLNAAKWLYDAGPECHKVLCSDEGTENQEMFSRLVICYSAIATWEGTCINLASSTNFNGTTSALRIRTTGIKDIINAVSNVYVLFPLLEDLSLTSDSEFDLDAFFSSSSPISEQISQQLNDWEVLPSNTFMEWKLDQNPVSMFLNLLKNIINGSYLNQEELVKYDGFGIVGLLLQQCKPSLIDVNVLMATQHFIETIRNLSHHVLLKSIYQHILFDFKIWSRGPFPIRIGHVQYISNLIKHDRSYFRKNFGVQFILDVIRIFYSTCDVLSEDDSKAIRLALLGIIKYLISKDFNIKELLSILGFLVSVKEEFLLIETMEMLITQMETKNCKDQIFLLLHEQYTGEILYVLLLNRKSSEEFKIVVSKFILTIIQTDRVHLRNKSTMLLQEGNISMYPGLIGFMDTTDFSPTLASNLFDIMSTGETKGGYIGILALIHSLSFESIDIKLKLAKKLLTATFINLNSPFIIAKQIGWQDCVARLLVKKCISDSSVIEEALDLMTFDEEALKLESDSISFHSTHLPSLSEAANVIEHEIKEIAGSVSEAVADNLQYAADNLTTAVASVCSVIKQKTVDIQESLGELGHISRSHLSSLNENDSMDFNTDSDSLAISNRSISVASNEEEKYNSGLFFDDESNKQSVSLPHDLNLETNVNNEENLCYLVAHILFTILWRGVDGSTKESWKERGQVMAFINLLALNNELYCSHLQLRLRLLEMAVQAALIDLKETGSTAGPKANVLHLMRLIYDLVVLDPNKDETKKCSAKLLDGVIALLDTMKVFSGDTTDIINQELARLGLGILVVCATSNGNSEAANTASRVELAAPACALLNSLLHAGGPPISGDADTEAAYLICAISSAMKMAVEIGNRDQYSFLIPVMKSLLEKTSDSMNLSKYLPDLPSLSKGPSFFVDFETFIQEDQWTSFIEYKIRPLSIAYDRETSRLVGEPLNTFWAECYEACKASAQARVQEQMYSKELFQRHVITSFRARQSEDFQRFIAVQGQQRTRAARAAANWRSRRAFLTGPRGAWTQGTELTKYWRLSPHENLSRMRLKLEAQADIQPASLAAAARLRDNLERAPQPTKPVAPPRAPRAHHDSIADEELKLSLEPEIQLSESGKEKMIVSQDCELITLMTKVKGRFDVTTCCLYFHDLTPNKEDVERQDFTISLPQLREIHLRRYNLRRSALEIFLIDQTNYFLNFSTKTRNMVFSRILSLQPPNILYGSGQSPSELLKASGLTQKWINREITNFDYLMHLNTIAGRTYNDLSQYPVYPWILADYTSEILDLDNPASFRDLSKPIGVVNSKNETEVRAKFDNFEDPTGVISKFHYGTHYSNSAGVLHYLLRVEPFTSLHIELQSGRFDVADRQFHSIAQTWKMLMNNPNDVKELTPEFFYFPEFLKNINKLDLGILQGTNYEIGDVALPPWAEGSAENFVYLHRKALESDYVSENLHNWIDLIFGYKQKGPRAIEALNVFYYCSYEGAVDLDAIADPSERAALEGMIANFGQVPAQLIRSSSHPVRLTSRRAAARALRGEIRSLHCLHLLSHLTTTSIQISRPDDPIIWLGGPCRGRGFLQGGGRWLTTLTRSGILYTPSWQPTSPTGQVLEPESTSSSLKTRRQISVIGENNANINSKLIAMSSDGKILYTGGHWDCSIKIYTISSKIKIAGVVTKHFGPVTCLALDSCSEQWLISGSSDTSLAVWEVGSSPGNLQLKNFLCGHDAAITCVSVMAELDIIVSGSEDGTVNMYTLKKGEFVRTLHPKGCQGIDINVKFIVLSHQGHIGFVVNDQIYHSVHVYNINGNWQASRNVCGRVTTLCTVGDCLLIADDAGDITISTTHSLKPVYDVPLHVPIEHVLITPHNTHVLVSLRDGKIAIIGLPPVNKNMPTIDTV